MSASRPTKAEQAEIEEAREKLLEWLSPGDTVWTILRSVSRSGMTRHIEPVIIDEDREPMRIGGYVAKVLGYKWADDGGVVVGGCGMDMGFSLVYSLSRTLWPDGFECIAPRVFLFDDEIVKGRYPHIGAFETRDLGDGIETGEIHPEPLSGYDAWGKREYRVWEHGCPSNDHSNREHNAWHKDGGYALRQRWM